jgi:PEP-CTERM motif
LPGEGYESTDQRIRDHLGSTVVGARDAPGQRRRVDGTLDAVPVDDGTGVFAGTPIGNHFSGFIDDVTANGQLGDGTTMVSFGCCLAAGRLEIFNDEMLDAETAALLNALAGASVYAEGSVVDSVNIEGDTSTGTGGRIEIGVSYVLDSGTFANTLPGNYPFDPTALRLALFFIFEEDAIGTEIFNASGRLPMAPIPEPSIVGLWLAGAALLSIVVALRRRPGSSRRGLPLHRARLGCQSNGT